MTKWVTSQRLLFNTQAGQRVTVKYIHAHIHCYKLNGEITLCVLRQVLWSESVSLLIKRVGLPRLLAELRHQRYEFLAQSGAWQTHLYPPGAEGCKLKSVDGSWHVVWQEQALQDPGQEKQEGKLVLCLVSWVNHQEIQKAEGNRLEALEKYAWFSDAAVGGVERTCSKGHHWVRHVYLWSSVLQFACNFKAIFLV